MKILLVSWMFLLFGVSLSFGHYIRKLEDADSQVNRVTEDRSGVKFVNPKPEKPTLREILYYHIVERDFGKEEPANSITERSLTNSHGFQFLKDADDGSSETENIDDEHDEDYKENDGMEYERQKEENKLQDEIQKEEQAEPVTEAKPLTEEDVKEAYKHRSYLFDQLRQRYSTLKRMILPETWSRKKREADFEEIPDAPELPESSPKDAYMQPKTYGMNLDSDGGYVWNNLNNPPVYYEVGQSTENPNEGQAQSESGQSQETQPSAEANVPHVTENTGSGSSEDIYVSTDRRPATPIAIEETPENESEVVEESEEPVFNPNEKFEASDIPIEPIVNDDSVPENYNPNEKLEASEKPIEPVVNDDSVPEDYNPGAENPEFENPEKPEESGEPVEKPADSGLDAAGSSTEGSEREEAKVIPEAPMLPPLNYDNLPDYIREAISSTEKSESHEQIDNPFINPQLDPEDKKKLEEKMEDIFSTAQPVEDIPKTYGVNLTGDSGHVWNDMVNPPVSHDVGSTDRKEEEPKAPEPTEQTIQESQEEPKPEEQPALEIPGDKETEVPEIPKVPELQNPEENVPEIPKVPESENPEEKEEEVPEIPKVPTSENPEDKEAEVPEIPKVPASENPEDKEAEIPEIPIVPELGNPEDKEAEIPEIPKVPESENPEDKEAEVPEISELENPEPLPENPEVEDKPAGLPIEPTPENKEPNLEPGSSEGEIENPDDAEETGDMLPDPKPEDDKEPDIMSELLKSDAFWKWLGEWAATYTELLEKHMRKIAIQEICNREKSGTDMCLINDQSEDNELIIKDGKIIIDGKEIPVTHNSNFDGLRRGNNNNKDKENNKVVATTIYGNSLGNEKVNNVFIFNAVDAKEVLEELKPGNDSKIDIIIDERGKESEEEHKEEDKIEDKIEEPKESEEVEKTIEEQKEIEAKPISSELESDKESTEKLPLEE